jgi:hypothetical protein
LDLFASGPGFGDAHRKISFTLGTEAGEMPPNRFTEEADGQQLQLIIISSWWWIPAVLFSLFLSGSYLAARHSDSIRDNVLQPATGKRPTALLAFRWRSGLS